MKYGLVLFDFDGTVMDTSAAVFYSARSTMAGLGLPVKPDVNMNLFVGPPLGDCFRLTFGLEEKYVGKACEIYRRYYASTGRYRASFYPNVQQSLEKLNSMEMPMCITTMKSSALAQSMIDHFGLSKYFGRVIGADLAGVRTKADLVNEAVSEHCMEGSRDRVLLVGDTMLDADGAKAAGTDFLGVSFGFGQFTDEQKRAFRHPLMDDWSELAGFVT